LNIKVSEQPAVAALELDGAKTAVAADGVVLGAAHVSSSLPTLAATVALTAGEHIHGAALLAALSVLGAAPAPLANDVQSVYSGSKGLTLVLRGNVRAYFGDATRPHAKWAALARVLADSSSAGASYVDVRLPEHPAAGFPPGTRPPASDAETERSNTSSAPGSSESSEALAEGLAAAVGGGTSSASSSVSPSATAATGEAEGSAAKGEAESSATTGEAGASSGGSGESNSPESTEH
jgi:cell division protein FtsQ